MLNKMNKINNCVNNLGTPLPIQDLESQCVEKNKDKYAFLKITALNGAAVGFVSLLIGLFELNVIPSHKAGFYCKDPKLSYKFDGDTVPNAVLAVSIILLPLPTLFITEYFIIERETFKARSLETFKNVFFATRSYFVGVMLNLMTVEVMKVITGSPRPTFFDICNPDTGRTCIEGVYVSSFKCTPNPILGSWLQSDASHSFPSGHTSLSVYCAVFISWYLQQRVFSWSSQCCMLVPLVQMASIAYCVICSLSRITDHRHHWWDVLAGCVIGVVSAVYAVMVLSGNFKHLITEKRLSETHIHQNNERIEQIAL